MEKSLLVKGLGFYLAPKQLNYSDHLINFELLDRSIDNLKILSADNLDFIQKLGLKVMPLLFFVTMI